MGLFDFLKTSVKDGKKKPGAKAAGARKAASGSSIAFDGKSFPLAAITTKGFSTSSFDGSLISGQNARVTVTVDDQYGRFSFTTNVMISEADNSKCVGAWMMIAPDLEAVIRKYGQNKKAAGK
ncbi:hypothetical protein [Azospirillum sp. sgz301742]